MFPKLIFQTWKTHDIPKEWESWHNSWEKYNPDYEFVLHDDYENRELVRKHFPGYLELYDSFHAEIYRADIIRYFFLYKYGGIYADLDFECLRPFDSLLEEQKNKEIILGRVKKRYLYSLPNAIMISKPGNKFWIEVINKIYEAPIEDRKRSPDAITGPVPLENTYYGLTDKDQFAIMDDYVFYNLNYGHLIALNRDKKNTRFHIAMSRAEAIARDSYAFTYWSHSWGGTWE